MTSSPGDDPSRPGELAWAAGLFEGEGTITVCRGRTRLALRMTAESSVRRFAAAVAVGRVYGPYANAAAERADGHPRQPALMWVAEQDEARSALERLAPHLSEWRLARGRELWPETVRRENDRQAA